MTAKRKTLSSVVGTLLAGKCLTLAIAESCTGGMVSERVTESPGSSAYYVGGLVAYANHVKSSLLGIPKKLLRDRGAVSAVVAMKMAVGIRKIFKADYGLAVTGIAGPGGASQHKPLGLVYLSVASKRESLTRRYIFSGERSQVRKKATLAALNFLKNALSRQTRPDF